VIVHEGPDAVAALDRLLWERWRGKVRRGGAGSKRPGFLFAPILTVNSGDSEMRVKKEDNAGTNNCL
jgi:hypothetical protein